jgi:hypothetical protein
VHIHLKEVPAVKRSQALVLATTVALGLAALGQTASAAVSKHPSAPPGITVANGKIGAALPSPGAAARIRTLGLDDGEGGLGSDDGGGLLTAGGHAAHGTIGSAAPSATAAARIAALGLDD